MWFGKQRGMQNWLCDGLGLLLGAAGGLGCAKGLRRSRRDCSDGTTSRNGGFSPLSQPTTPCKSAWPASVTWNMPWPGGQTPALHVEVPKGLPQKNELQRKITSLEQGRIRIAARLASCVSFDWAPFLPLFFAPAFCLVLLCVFGQVFVSSTLEMHLLICDIYTV